MTQKFWAETKLGVVHYRVGPRDSRETAMLAMLDDLPALLRVKSRRWHQRHKYAKISVLVGYGEYGPHFDMRWTDIDLSSIKL